MRFKLLLSIIMLLGVSAFTGCAVPEKGVLRLVPVPVDENGPVVCKISYVAENTPAEAAGLAPGDDIRRIDGKEFREAAEFLNALNDAPESLRLGVGRNGLEREVIVKLAAKPPRLGVRCDIAGVQAVVEDENSVDRYIVVENRKGIAISAEATLDGGLLRATMSVQNYTGSAVAIDPASWTATDGTGVTLARISVSDAVRHLKGNAEAMVRASQTVELKAEPVESQGESAGSLYFAGPAAYPVRLIGNVGGEKFEFHFENRKKL